AEIAKAGVPRAVDRIPATNSWVKYRTTTHQTRSANGNPQIAPWVVLPITAAPATAAAEAITAPSCHRLRALGPPSAAARAPTRMMKVTSVPVWISHASGSLGMGGLRN